MSWKHPTSMGKNRLKDWPDSVAIVALGTSRVDYDEMRLAKRVEPVPWDAGEVWVVNRGLRLWEHDLAFVMDDLERENAEDPDYGASIQTNKSPIITSDAHDARYGMHVHALPLEEMSQWAMERNIRRYWVNSIPIMIAYALFIGVKEIYIHGADYTAPNGQVMEAGRSNVEYWIGVGDMLGARIGISPRCRLIGQHDYQPGYVYGYDRQWRARQIVELGESLAAAGPSEPNSAG